jgi:hypothetical protein
MKIVEYTSTKLTICANRPARHWIVGITFMLVGLTAIAAPEQVTTFTCDRQSPNQGSCELVHSSLLWSDAMTIPLENLQEAKIQVNESQTNDSSRIVLVTTQAEIPLMTDSSANLQEQEIRVNTVNNFIRDSSQKHLKIEEDNRLFAYIFGGLFLFAGVVGSGVITKEFTCHFDKTVGSLMLIKKGILWTRRVKKPMSDIIGLRVDSVKQQEKKNYRVSLVLMSGKRIGLTSGKESNRTEIKTLINCLTTFLDVGITNHR